MTLRVFELMGGCGELSGDGVRTETWWTFFLYVWADDVNWRQTLGDRTIDNRVAESMANVFKVYQNLLAVCNFSKCA